MKFKSKYVCKECSDGGYKCEIIVHEPTDSKIQPIQHVCLFEWDSIALWERVIENNILDKMPKESSNG